MDFNGLIEPLVVMSALFGLAPFTRSKSPLGIRYRKSRPALIVSALWLAAMLALMQLSLPFVDHDLGVFIRTSWVIYVSNVLQGLCGYLLFIYTHAVAFLTRDQKLAMFASFSDLGVVLGETTASYRRYRRYLVTQLLVYTLFVVAGSASLLLGTFSAANVMRMAVICVASMANTLAEVHFCNSIAMLRQLCVRFNKKLLEIETHDRRELDVDIPRELGLVQQCWLQPWQKRHKPISTEDDCGAFLRHHETLFELAREINCMYGVQNVLTVSQIFLYLLNMLYAIVDRAMHSGSKALLGAIIYNVMLQLVRLVIPVALCCSVARQADLCAFIASKLQTGAKSARVRKQMSEFSAQLPHRRLKFGACSLFAIDGTLILGVSALIGGEAWFLSCAPKHASSSPPQIIGGVTSYLVILIQFQCVPPN